MLDRNWDREARERCIQIINNDAALHCAAVERFGETHADHIWSRVTTHELEALLAEFQRNEGIIMMNVNSADILPHPAFAGIEQGFSLDNLSSSDRVALSSYMVNTFPVTQSADGVIPAPLEDLMTQAGIAPVALWHSLRNTTDIRLMIAAAALRSVTRLPDDPRLDPKPHDRAPVKSPRSPEEATRQRRVPVTSAASAGEYVASVVQNPKRRGTAAWDRYAQYQVGMSRAQLRDLGLTHTDFKYDSDHNYVTWRDTAEAPITEEA
jgi:hypothetical protein